MIAFIDTDSYYWVRRLDKIVTSQSVLNDLAVLTTRVNDSEAGPAWDKPRQSTVTSPGITVTRHNKWA